MEAMPDTLELLKKVKVTYLGELRQLGLGKPGGINTLKTASEIKEAALRIPEILRPIDDPFHYSCIDDRFCKCNADKSAPRARAGQAGGTLSPTVTALYGGMDIIKTLPKNTDINDFIWALDDEVSKLMQVFPSSHTGGCGAAKQLLPSSIDLANSANLSDAVKVLLEGLAGIEGYGSHRFDRAQYSQIQDETGLLLPTLEGWKPSSFTDRVVQDEPNGVEELNYDESLPHHGHKTDVIIIIASKGLTVPRELIPTIGLNGGFVWNIDESKRISDNLAGHEGMTGANRAFLANIAFHLATAGNLIENQHIVLVEA